MNGTILAIDDQDDNLALLEAALGAQGFAFHGATGGLAGLSLARELKPDLLLLDLSMPDMDGFEVLAQLRADPTTRTLPVIILTASYRESSMIERGFELGATEYLTKPIQMEELLVRIRSTMRLSRAERELERLRRDFASMLVHDMRAPLDGVRLVLMALRRQEAADSSRTELLTLALGSLVDVGNLIEDLLTVNQLEDEGFTACSEPVDVASLAAASVQSLRPIAEARGLALRAELPATGLVAEVDAKLTKRVLDNMLANALKFTDEGEVVVTALARDGGVEIAVRDTGPGIAPEVLPHVFERYFHLERRRVDRQGGLGLGLAFCQRAVTVMGGTLAVESKLDCGSTFRVWLPSVVETRVVA
jgi:signal transduction histidine kinase